MKHRAFFITAIMAVWVISELILANTPASFLNAHGLGWLPGFATAMGCIFGLALAAVGLRLRRSTPRPLYVINQILCLTVPLVVLAVFIAVFYKVAILKEG